MTAPGYPLTPPAFPVAPHVAVPQKLRTHRLIYVLVSVIGCIAVVLVGVAVLLRPATPTCGLACYRPPVGPAVTAQHTYTSSAFGYSIGYYDHSGGLPAPQVATSASSLVLDYGNNGAIRFTGLRPNGRTPAQVAAQFVSSLGVGAQEAYQLPNSQVGYQVGFGAAYDVAPQSGTGSATPQRLIVQVAQRGNLDILAACEGSYLRFTPDGANNGHPSPADSIIASVTDIPLNAVTWPVGLH